jgi:hypothetical protein
MTSEKLTLTQMVNTFSGFYGMRRFITVFAKACHLTFYSTLYPEGKVCVLSMLSNFTLGYAITKVCGNQDDSELDATPSDSSPC